MTTTTNDPRPIPGALDGLPWRVRTMAPTIDNNTRVHGYTNNAEHEMAVPHGTSARARWVAMHELAHARWTPAKSKPSAIIKRNPPATEVDVQVMEDLRVNSLLHRAGLFNLHCDSAADISKRAKLFAEEFANVPARPSLLEVLTFAHLQAGHLIPRTNVLEIERAPVGHELLTMLRQMLEHIAAQAHDAGRNTEAETALARDLIRNASTIATTVAKTLVPKRARPSDPLPHKLIGPAAALLRRLLQAEKEIAQQGGSTPGSIAPHHNSKAGQFGTLVDLPPLPLTETSPATAATRKKINAPTGSRLRNLRRLLTDGRAFARTISKEAKGGTVLIDTSGSMHLRAEEVHAVLAAIPAATVAIYSGARTTGSVSVIAKNGRVASAAAIKRRISEVGGGNIVDGPALQWLGKQAEPRLWVCDGVVTGCHDTACRVLDREAEALRRRHAVRRFDSLPELTRHLQEATR